MLFPKTLSRLFPIVAGGLVYRLVSAAAVNNNPPPRCTLVGLIRNQQHALTEPFKCDGQAHDTCRGLYTTMQSGLFMQNPESSTIDIAGVTCQAGKCKVACVGGWKPDSMNANCLRTEYRVAYRNACCGNAKPGPLGVCFCTVNQDNGQSWRLNAEGSACEKIFG